METSPSHNRVIQAFEFHAPDRIPRYDTFWDYPEEWEKTLGPREAFSDIAV